MDVKSERRGYKRFTVDPILCHAVPKVQGICLLKNVSMGGAFFLNKSPPPIGSKVRIEFVELPLEGYEVNGNVVRHGLGRYRGFALEFPTPRPKVLRAVYHTEMFEE